MSLDDRNIDEAALARLARLAPGAIARRGGGWMLATWLRILGIPVNIAIGAGFLVAAGWQPATLVLLFFVGVFAGMAGDALRLALAGPWVARAVRHHNDDRWAFEVASCLRSGKTRYRSDLTTGYRPRVGLLLDVTFGFMGSLVVLAGMNHFGVDLWADVERDPSVAWMLLSTAAWPLGTAILHVLQLRIAGDSDGVAMVSSGERGLGLFFLMLAFAACVEGFDLVGQAAAGALLACAWIGSLLVAVLLAWSTWLVARDRNWLSRWLAGARA